MVPMTYSDPHKVLACAELNLSMYKGAMSNARMMESHLNNVKNHILTLFRSDSIIRALLNAPFYMVPMAYSDPGKVRAHIELNLSMYKGAMSNARMMESHLNNVKNHILTLFRWDSIIRALLNAPLYMVPMTYSDPHKVLACAELNLSMYKGAMSNARMMESHLNNVKNHILTLFRWDSIIRALLNAPLYMVPMTYSDPHKVLACAELNLSMYKGAMSNARMMESHLNNVKNHILTLFRWDSIIRALLNAPLYMVPMTYSDPHKVLACAELNLSMYKGAMSNARMMESHLNNVKNHILTLFRSDSIIRALLNAPLYMVPMTYSDPHKVRAHTELNLSMYKGAMSNARMMESHLNNVKNHILTLFRSDSIIRALLNAPLYMVPMTYSDPHKVRACAELNLSMYKGAMSNARMMESHLNNVKNHILTLFRSDSIIRALLNAPLYMVPMIYSDPGKVRAHIELNLSVYKGAMSNARMMESHLNNVKNHILTLFRSDSIIRALLNAPLYMVPMIYS